MDTRPLHELSHEEAISRWASLFADSLDTQDFDEAERAVRMVIALQMIEEAHGDVRRV